MDFKWLKVSDYDEDILFRYILDGENHEIKVNDFPEFGYIAENECGKAYLDQSGKIVYGYISWASGQGGIVFVWDIYHNKVIHVSENVFVVELLLDGNRLFALRDVCYYGHSAELKVCYSDIISGERELKWNPISIPYTSSKGNQYFYLKVKSNHLILGSSNSKEFKNNDLVSVKLPPREGYTYVNVERKKTRNYPHEYFGLIWRIINVGKQIATNIYNDWKYYPEAVELIESHYNDSKTSIIDILHCDFNEFVRTCIYSFDNALYELDIVKELKQQKELYLSSFEFKIFVREGIVIYAEKVFGKKPEQIVLPLQSIRMLIRQGFEGMSLSYDALPQDSVTPKSVWDYCYAHHMLERFNGLVNGYSPVTSALYLRGMTKFLNAKFGKFQERNWT